MSELRWSAIDSFVGNHGAPELTFHRPCPICGQTVSRELVALRDHQFFTDDARRPKRADVRFVQCRGCFAVFLNPCYTDRGFEVLFEEAGASYGTTDVRAGEQRRCLEDLELLRPEMTVLDIGCNDGAFLAELPAGIKKIGVDMDAPAIRRGQERYGAELELVLGAVETLELSAAPDLVTLFNVLEHVTEPVELLRSLRRRARPGTKIIVEVPLVECFADGDNLTAMFSIQHPTHFTWGSVQHALARSGWRMIWRHESGWGRFLAEPCDAGEGSAAPGDHQWANRLLAGYAAAMVRAEAAVDAFPDAPRYAIWGAGIHTEMLYHATSLFSRRLDRQYVLLDRDPLKHGRSWRGISIYPVERIADVLDGSTPLLASSFYSWQEIAREAETRGVKRVLSIYEGDDQ